MGTTPIDERILFQFDDSRRQRSIDICILITDAVPALLKAGFAEQDVHTFLVENPRQFFERASS